MKIQNEFSTIQLRPRKVDATNVPARCCSGTVRCDGGGWKKGGKFRLEPNCPQVINPTPLYVRKQSEFCNDVCSIELVESIPVGINYSNSTVSTRSTYDAWMYLLSHARRTVDMTAFYWTLDMGPAYVNDSQWMVSDL
jgi:hypothetical protein